jgi:uncharacterized protein
MPADRPTDRHTNRLARETSPYLQQHQHNPVDWHPWGSEAFDLARSQNKPIFLSVGYSTCYWCHVMERECFENDAIARLMNEHFVNIKVDREERPDVDQLYMTAVQVMTGQGGWPMSVWLTPDLRPFYGGTYFPPSDSYGRAGFPRVLEALTEAWHQRRDDIERSASDLTRAIRSVASPKSTDERPLSASDIDRLVSRSVADYEPRFGGFGGAPKFPRQTLLQLLLTWTAGRPDAEHVRAMLRHTLDAMANGGIRDHLGGGFHRYSTDARWLVPHFEIMLYDQAMLASVYARASRAFDEPRYAAVARGICDFVLRDMTGTDGEFFTAFDAEVDHQEGLNYLWTVDEVKAVLGADAEHFNTLYGLADGPNFADPHHGNGVPDKNILFLPAGPRSDRGDEKDPAVDDMRRRLLAARALRKQPLLDTKVITSWNALMADALAVAGEALKEPIYLEAAQRNAHFLLNRHLKPDGDLCRTSRDGQTRHAGFLDDYAFLARALLCLGDVTKDARWRREADVVATHMLRRFGDTSGGLYFTAADAPDLIARQQTASDSPLPSGNALAATALHGLGQAERARQIVNHFAEPLRQYAESMSSLLEAALCLELPPESAVDAQEVQQLPTEPGVLALSASRVGDKRIEVHVVIDPKYHLYDTNIDPKLGLHATRLRVEGEASTLVDFIDYPPGHLLQLPYGPPVSAYSGNLVLAVTFKHPLPSSPVTLSLSYQACDDAKCLLPAVASVIV